MNAPAASSTALTVAPPGLRPATAATDARRRLSELLAEHAAAEGHPPPPALPEQDDVELVTRLAGLEIILSHSLARRPELLRLACRFGALPAERQEAAMWRLLSLQREMALACSVSLGLDPRTEEVIHAQALPLAGLRASHLSEALQVMHDRAMAWREHGFLDEQEDPPPGT